MENTHSNRDFYFSAYLVSAGCKMQGVTKDHGISTFIFAANEKIAELTAKYYTMQALVEPISYGNALKGLKSVIHSTDTNSNSQGTYNNVNRNTNRK